MRSIDPRLVSILLLIGLLGGLATASSTILPQVEEVEPAKSSAQVSDAAKRISDQVSTQEWLGPIAAVALSPFFGLTCLSGMATYGPDWLQSRTSLLGGESYLNNPVLFWTMFGLTLVTSLPRFTKISKPIALLAENLEAYSAVVILMVVRFAASANQQADDVSAVGVTGSIVLQAGFVSMGTDLMLSLAAAINLIVINTIKLSIEFFVWLVPVPFIDSVLELTNKSLCALFIGLYAYSPFLATLLNLTLFVACALIFLQVTRYMRYFKCLYLWAAIRASLGYDEHAEKVVSGFTTKRWRGIPAKSEWKLARLEGDRFDVSYDTWLTSHRLGVAHATPLAPGLLVDRVTVLIDGNEMELEVRKGAIFPVSERSPELSNAAQ